jgi:hypothetical protein
VRRVIRKAIKPAPGEVAVCCSGRTRLDLTAIVVVRAACGAALAMGAEACVCAEKTARRLRGWQVVSVVEALVPEARRTESMTESDISDQ